MNHSHIIIFDGECNLCHGAVNFIINRDSDGRFAFSPLQSQFSQEYIRLHGLETLMFDSLFLIKDDSRYIRSDAVIEIAKELPGYWKWLRFLKLIPRPIRDYFYLLTARNRYRLFGRRATCMLPSPALSDRFIG